MVEVRDGALVATDLVATEMAVGWEVGSAWRMAEVAAVDAAKPVVARQVEGVERG